MAKCNICGKKWWFSSRVKCDCRSREIHNFSMTPLLLLHSFLSEQDSKRNCMNDSLISKSHTTDTNDSHKSHCESSYTTSRSDSYSSDCSSSSSDSSSSSYNDSGSW